MTQVRDVVVSVNRLNVGVAVNPSVPTIHTDTNRVSVSCQNINVKVNPTVVVPRVTQVVRSPVIRNVDLEVVTLAVPGPKGADGSGIITVPFEWNSITILPLTVAVADKAVLRVEVCMVEAFNGVSPSISVGDSADHERLMPAIDVDPSQLATFSVHPGHRYPSNTQVNIYINSGSGPSAGSGVASIVMEQ